MPNQESNLNNILQEYKIKMSCVNYKHNHHFSIYDLALNNGCKIKSIENISTELQLKLNHKSKPLFLLKDGFVRMIFADKAEKITLTNLIQNKNFSDTDIILGVDYEGNCVSIDIAKMPHAIIAGTTGSGKSVFLHTIIANFLLTDRPVDLYLFDPKYVEFEEYKQLATNKYRTVMIKNTYEDIIEELKVLHKIMENRFEFLSNKGFRNIKDYNASNSNKLRYVLCIIDEFADLISKDKAKEFEKLICSIAAKSRAAGIHLIVATQRPSVDVVTGLIKANFPTRICFKVSASVDSRVVIEQNGAENLMFGGDGLLFGYGEPIRFQSAYIEPKNCYMYF